jgi:hypothetical protein
MKFEADDPNTICVMYPTGGYGNWLYYLVSQHLAHTVKTNPLNWQFGSTGDSHSYPKHTENFKLGSWFQSRKDQKFEYNYGVNSAECASQIQQGSWPVVLCDMGNLGDSVVFLRRYFPRARILRIYAKTFQEKLIVWANCMSKSWKDSDDQVYKDSAMPISGIATFAGVDKNAVTDDMAIACLVDFFSRNFEPFGRFFSRPSEQDNVINIPVHKFWSVSSTNLLMAEMARDFNTSIVDKDIMLSQTQHFLSVQNNLRLLENRHDSLLQQAVDKFQSCH